jgi:hypothetical protein
VSPQAANIERAGFAVLGVVIKAIEDAGAAAAANGLNVTLDAQARRGHQGLCPGCQGCGARYGGKVNGAIANKTQLRQVRKEPPKDVVEGVRTIWNEARAALRK